MGYGTGTGAALHLRRFFPNLYNKHSSDIHIYSVQLKEAEYTVTETETERKMEFRLTT